MKYTWECTCTHKYKHLLTFECMHTDICTCSTHIHMHIYIPTETCWHTNICKHTPLHEITYFNSHIKTHIPMCIVMHAFTWCIGTNSHACKHADIHTHCITSSPQAYMPSGTFTSDSTHIYIEICTHTPMHTHV